MYTEKKVDLKNMISLVPLLRDFGDSSKLLKTKGGGRLCIHSCFHAVFGEILSPPVNQQRGASKQVGQVACESLEFPPLFVIFPAKKHASL